MKILQPKDRITSHYIDETLRETYLDNAYLVLNKVLNKEDTYSMGVIPSVCRDTFLHTVHNLFAGNKDSPPKMEVTCALLLPKAWRKSFSDIVINNSPPAQKKYNKTHLHDLQNCFVENRLFNYFHTNPWQIYNNYIDSKFMLEFKLEKINFWDVVTVDAVIFKIYNQTYLDPALFWLMTQELRLQLTGFSKIDIRSVEYQERYYQSLLNVLKANILFTASTKIIYKYNFLDGRFLEIHSPANLINKFITNINFLLAIYTGSNQSTISPKDILMYQQLKDSFILLESAHINITLSKIRTSIGSLDTHKLVNLIDLIMGK